MVLEALELAGAAIFPLSDIPANSIGVGGLAAGLEALAARYQGWPSNLMLGEYLWPRDGESQANEAVAREENTIYEAAGSHLTEEQLKWHAVAGDPLPTPSFSPRACEPLEERSLQHLRELWQATRGGGVGATLTTTLQPAQSSTSEEATVDYLVPAQHQLPTTASETDDVTVGWQPLQPTTTLPALKRRLRRFRFTQQPPICTPTPRRMSVAGIVQESISISLDTQLMSLSSGGSSLQGDGVLIGDWWLSSTDNSSGGASHTEAEEVVLGEAYPPTSVVRCDTKCTKAAADGRKHSRRSGRKHRR
jgi:hypothetical protein